MLTRRTVLAHIAGLGGTTALAGCVLDTTNDSSMSIHLEEVPREQLGQKDAFTPDELEPIARETVSDGLTNGTTVYGTKPLAAGTFVVSNGSYYVVRITQNGTEAVERPVLEAEKVSSPNGTVRDWGNLSRSDALTLRCAVTTRDEQDAHPCVIFSGSDSAFWPELRFQYLESGDELYYRLHTTERTVTLDRYDYTFEPIASNRSSFADYVARERIAIDFSTADLSAEQRDILRTAATEGVYRESPPPYSDALRELVEWVRSVDDNNTVYVRFNGTYYEASERQSFDD